MIEKAKHSKVSYDHEISSFGAVRDVWIEYVLLRMHFRAPSDFIAKRDVNVCLQFTRRALAPDNLTGYDLHAARFRFVIAKSAQS
jgi:hypothetical protein